MAQDTKTGVSLHVQVSLPHSPYVLWLGLSNFSPIICSCLLIHLPPKEGCSFLLCISPCLPYLILKPNKWYLKPSALNSPKPKGKTHVPPRTSHREKQSFNTEYQQTETLHKSSPFPEQTDISRMSPSPIIHSCSFPAEFSLLNYRTEKSLRTARYGCTHLASQNLGGHGRIRHLRQA